MVFYALLPPGTIGNHVFVYSECQPIDHLTCRVTPLLTGLAQNDPDQRLRCTYDLPTDDVRRHEVTRQEATSGIATYRNMYVCFAQFDSGRPRRWTYGVVYDTVWCYTYSTIVLQLAQTKVSFRFPDETLCSLDFVGYVLRPFDGASLDVVPVAKLVDETRKMVQRFVDGERSVEKLFEECPLAGTAPAPTDLIPCIDKDGVFDVTVEDALTDTIEELQGADLRTYALPPPARKPAPMPSKAVHRTCSHGPLPWYGNLETPHSNDVSAFAMGSVIDLNDIDAGVVLDTSALSQVLEGYGDFPEAILVRTEMKMVWQILYNNFVGNGPRHQYVVTGSSTVGKSALVVLFCCYLATHHGYRIYLSRSRPWARPAVLFFHGAYVTQDKHFRQNHDEILDHEFVLSGLYRRPDKFLVVADGYDQESLKGFGMQVLHGFDMMTTSAPFGLAGPDPPRLVALPAWSRDSLRSLHPEATDLDERYAYSGGSVGDFNSTMDDLRKRKKIHCDDDDGGSALCVSYLQFRATDVKTHQRLYVTDVHDIAVYQHSPDTCKYVVDSAVVLKQLVSIRIVPLATFVSTLRAAEAMATKDLHGMAFEMLIHKLAYVKKLTLRLSSDQSTKTLQVGPTWRPIAGQKTLAACLDFLQTKATTNMYWYPNFPTFPAIDSVLIDHDTVYYLTMTVDKAYTVDTANLEAIHSAVLANKGLSHLRFAHVVVTPPATPLDRELGSLGGISMWHGRAIKTSECEGLVSLE